ncbi:DEAD/DEAH box helicase [Lentibacter algarum]|uniref:DEAD/DEAH box helicase n=1 Tax=Lentibacter algarum TaxID=576131 RepID=UPI00339D60B5
MKKALADALQERGYDKLTPVQEAVSKDELTGKDMLVSAQTGSGKTVGFGLAIAPALLGDEETFGQAGAPLALVIAPTRELALQVKREFIWLYGKAGATIASTVGGMDMRDERRALGRGAHMVVATPGRLRDHIMRGSIDLSNLKAVVLDEADEMLDLGFREDLEFILSEAPEERQTLLFSATVPASIGKLAKSYQTDAVRVETTAEKSQHADITYHAHNVSPRDAENAIINVLRYHEAPNAIVFGNTRAMVNRLTTRLSNRGFSVVALSGELSQNERTHALQAMRDGRARVCVATDVAARGIDLPNLDLVIHAELPNNHETLLHRSGRTGRAGRKGASALIVPPKARRKAERLLQMAKLKAVWSEAPSADAVRARDGERMLADQSWLEEVTTSERETVDMLVEGFTPEQLAAAYLRLHHQQHSAPEELSASGAGDAPKPREAFGPTVWFSVAGGNNAGAEPRRLLPAVCEAGGITKDVIGAIRIGPDESYFELKKEAADAFAAAASGNIEGSTLVRLDKAPDLAKMPKPAFKPRGDKPRGKPRGDKPRYDKPRGEPRGDKPSYDKAKFDKPRGEKPSHDKPKFDKPKPRPSKPKRPEETRPEGVVSAPAKRASAANPSERMDGKGKARGGKPGAKPAGKDGKPRWKTSGKKGPSDGHAPAVGKPNSKKNKARRAATSGTGKGGGAAPKRK